MQDLQEVTQDLHYENFRSERLKRAGRWDTDLHHLHSTWTHVSTWANTGIFVSCRAVDEDVVDKDQILLQKEAEVWSPVINTHVQAPKTNEMLYDH